MKKIGLWLLKNNIHIMTLIFLCWAVWGICNWNSIGIVSKLVLGIYFLLICHEYEETFEGGLMALFGPVVGIDPATLVPGKSHLAQAVYITVLFSLALLFPNVMWLVFPVFILAIFEGFVHTMGSFIFKLGKPSPGWYTAILMCAFAIWGLVVLNRNVNYPGIQWFWASLYYVGLFVLLETWFQHLIGNSLPHFARSMRAFVFGKK